MPPTDTPGPRQSFRRLRQWVLFPFLFPLFYVLHLARYYYGAVPAGDVLLISAGWTLLSVAIYGLLRIVIKNRLACGVAAFLIIILITCWYRILNPLLRFFHTGENYRHLPWIFLGFVLVIAVMAWSASRLKKKAAAAWLYYLNALLLLFVLSELVLLGWQAVRASYQPSLLLKNPAELSMDSSAKAGGNIYLLLFDEYASGKALKQYWGFDNGANDSFLKSRGFFVNENSHSNYCWTEFSMASLLHMDYFRRFNRAHNFCNEQDVQRSIVAIENARVFEVLHRAGYAIRPYSIFQVDSQAPEYIPELRLNKWRLVTVNSLIHAVRVNYLPYLLHYSEIKHDPNYHFPPFYQMNAYNDAGVEWVLRQAREQSHRPRFVYAHFFMPHDTYYYDSLGRLMPMARIQSITKEEEPRYYLFNLQHANRKMQQMVDSIQAHDPTASIIVLGDHGYRQHLYQDDRHPEYFLNLSALYFPDRDYRSLPDSFSNVNVFRLVLNKVCGTHYPLLPDHTCTLSLRN